MDDSSGSDSLEGIVWDLDWFPQDKFPPSCSYKCRARKDQPLKASTSCSPKSTLKRLRIETEEDDSSVPNEIMSKPPRKKIKVSHRARLRRHNNEEANSKNPFVLRVMNLSKNIDANDIADKFEEFGDVETVILDRDSEGKFTGNADVVFKNERSVEQAYEAIKVRYNIDGENNLDASMSPPK